MIEWLHVVCMKHVYVWPSLTGCVGEHVSRRGAVGDDGRRLPWSRSVERQRAGCGDLPGWSDCNWDKKKLFIYLMYI